jgi:uncharacterized protein YecT (DUF1311 family)
MRPLLILVVISLWLTSCAGEPTVDSPASDRANGPPTKMDNQVTNQAVVERTFTYELATKRIDLPGGYLDYVQLVRSNDETKQSRLNQLIAQEMTQLLTEWPAEDGEVMTWESTPEVHYRGAKLLSFSISGFVYAEGRPYPNTVFRGVTLDLETENILALDDLITVDGTLVDWMRTTAAEPGSAAYEEDVQLSYLLEQSDDELLSEIRSNLENHFYIERDSLTMMMRLPHVLGDWYPLQMNGPAWQAQRIISQAEWQRWLARAENQTAWQTLDEIEAGLADMRSKMSSGVTKDMVEALSETHRRWDLELNTIWARYKATLDEQAFAPLLREQRQWLTERDQQAEQAAKEFAGGTFARVAYLDSIANATKARCYELVERFE